MRYHYFTMARISNVGVCKRSCKEQKETDDTKQYDDLHENWSLYSLRDSFKRIVKS